MTSVVPFFDETHRTRGRLTSGGVGSPRQRAGRTPITDARQSPDQLAELHADGPGSLPRLRDFMW